MSHWNNKRLEEVCTIIAGQSPDSKYYNQDGAGIPFFQGKADFGSLYPTIRIYCSQPHKIAEKGDILLSVRAPVGPTNLAPCRVCIGRGLTAIRPNEELLTKFVLLFFRYYEAQLEQQGGGTTFKAITQATVKSIKIPVPSLDEQERIVAKIEELFSSLDNTTETLQRNKTLFKQYKLAVLSSAFKECSEKQSISQFASLVTSGSRGWAQYYSEQGVRFIRITDLSRDGIKLDDAKIQRVQLPHNVEGTRSRLNPHDILVSITADLGSIALVPEDIEESYINQHIALIRLKKPNQAKLIAWYLKSIEGRNALLKNKRGGGKLGLGLDDIRNTPVPCLSDHETKKIIAAIEAQLAVCEYQEAISEKVLRQISALKQSILKKAFEGKLA